MSARVIAIDGPSAGHSQRLEGELLSIGRESSNGLCLEDPTVSRQHCELRLGESGWTITDLETRNGTFVNGVPVQSRLLADHDEIRIGASRLLFVHGDSAPLQGTTPACAHWGLATRTLEAAPSRSRYLREETLEDAHYQGSRYRRELTALLNLSAQISESRTLADFERCLMESAFQTIPAEVGALLLTDAETGVLNETRGWSLKGGASPAPGFPMEELQAVAEQGSALLLQGSDRATSLLAAPLASADASGGVVALESSPGSEPFNSTHLEWLSAACVIAAPTLAAIRRFQWLENENRRLREEMSQRCNMVGESPAMGELLRQVARSAPVDTTVLIRGETGTGKELVARAIHAGSRRSGRPFVAVNCATLSESLLESDLFGHEKGSFTGAVAQKRGKIEIASGGTLFLDEIGELAPALQAKLLRVLQEREFERVGGTAPIRADIRLVAATNRNLEEGVQAGTFRRDLYYRLNVITIEVPPLRARREDIPLLASYFLAKYAEKLPRRVLGFSPAARWRLKAYDWPGNVRELENTVERAMVLGTQDLIQVEDLPESILERDLPPGMGEGRYHDVVKATKRSLILAALSGAKGNHQEAARQLGLNPTYLSRLIRNLDLKTALEPSAEN